jgi:DNA-binding SARP family transcriptional activator
MGRGGRRLRIGLLGAFEARLPSGRPVALASRRARALLAYLALHPGQPQARDTLATLLWGDAAARRARHSLRQVLVALRRALPRSGPRLLVETGDTVLLRPEAADVDVAALERLAAAGDPGALEQAAALYRGDLLEGLDVGEAPFEDWLLSERERLREVAMGVLARLLAHHADGGRPEAAIEAGVRLLALDPAQEPVHRRLMRLYAGQGRRGAALRQYQLCVAALGRELGLEPEPETKRLYQEILRRTPPPGPAAGAPGAPAGERAALAPVVELPAADTPLVGRETEVGELRAALEAADRGRGRVVLLLGEAGIGKTRLVAEAAALAAAGGARLLLGRCHESAQILPFGPWVEALRSGRVLEAHDVLDGLGEAWRRELGRLLPELVPGPAGEGARDDGALRLFEALARLLLGLAAPRALAVVLEDVHWADEMSLRFLAVLARRLAAARVLVVATAREEEVADAPALDRTLTELRREASTRVLALERLSREATARLVAALGRAGGDAGEAETRAERVWRASAGNPFIAVETCRALAAGAAPAAGPLPLPERVGELIGQRLARLGPRARELAEVAAVIGRAFEFAVLHRAAGLGARDAVGGVEELVRRRVLHAVGERFDFTHERIRDVVYGRLLGPRRAALHTAVGHALESVHAADLAPHHAALGAHYRLGAVWDRAARHLRLAGVQAAARSALPEARALLEQALDALAAAPAGPAALEDACDARLELRAVLAQLGDPAGARARLREAEALAARLGDEGRQGRVWAFLLNSHTTFGELDEALRTGARALEIAERLGDGRLRVLVTTYLAQARYYRGDYEAVARLAAESLRALPAEWRHEHFGNAAPAAVYDRAWRVLSLAQLGRFAEAAVDEAEMLRLAEPTGHAFTVGLARFAAGTRQLLQGRWTGARALLGRALAASHAGHVAVLLPYALGASAWALARLGQAAEAEARLRDGVERLRQEAAGGATGHRGWAYCALGQAALLLGRLDEARALGERVLEGFPGQIGFAAHARHLLGEIASHPGRLEAGTAEAHYREALRLAEARGMRPLAAHCHLGLADLHRRAGRQAEARAALGAAVERYRDTGMTAWLARAAAARAATG